MSCDASFSRALYVYVCDISWPFLGGVIQERKGEKKGINDLGYMKRNCMIEEGSTFVSTI